MNFSLCLSVLFLLLCTCQPCSRSKNIIVPTETDTIQKAVEMAVSGDTILLVLPVVNWGTQVVVEEGSGD